MQRSKCHKLGDPRPKVAVARAVAHAGARVRGGLGAESHHSAAAPTCLRERAHSVFSPMVVLTLAARSGRTRPDLRDKWLIYLVLLVA